MNIWNFEIWNYEKYKTYEHIRNWKYENMIIRTYENMNICIWPHVDPETYALERLGEPEGSESKWWERERLKRRACSFAMVFEIILGETSSQTIFDEFFENNRKKRVSRSDVFWTPTPSRTQAFQNSWSKTLSGIERETVGRKRSARRAPGWAYINMRRAHMWPMPAHLCVYRAHMGSLWHCLFYTCWCPSF